MGLNNSVRLIIMELIYFTRRRQRAGKSHKSLNTNKFQPGKLASRSRSAPLRDPRRPHAPGAGNAGRRRQTARPTPDGARRRRTAGQPSCHAGKNAGRKTPIRTRARGKTKPPITHARTRTDGRPHTHARETDSRPTTADGARRSARRRQPDRDADRQRDGDGGRRAGRQTKTERATTHGRQPERDPRRPHPDSRTAETRKHEKRLNNDYKTTRRQTIF